jgi:hypothetical protein
MDFTKPAIAAMADKCRMLVEVAGVSSSDLPESLRTPHIRWMCKQIALHAAIEDWPDTKLHRWLGFVQSAMMANRILDLNGAKTMFDSVKNEYRAMADDQDLFDHLNSESSFELDLGGQG